MGIPSRPRNRSAIAVVLGHRQSEVPRRRALLMPGQGERPAGVDEECTMAYLA